LPFGSPVGSKVFGSQCLERCFHPSIHLACAYVPPQASLTFKPRFQTCVPGRPGATLRSTSLELSCPLAFIKSTSPSFSPSFESVFGALPCIQRRPTLGFGYPLDELFQPVDPWKPLSAPHALGLSPSELFSSRRIGKEFLLLLSVLALFPKTSSALGRRLNGFLPSSKPYPSLPPVGLEPVGALASLGAFQPLGLSLHLPDGTSVSLVPFPFRCWLFSSLAKRGSPHP